MIADVSFAAPLPHPYAYLVPDGLPVSPGQRVRAPLGRAARVGIVVALRDGDASGLKPLLGLAEPRPIVSEAQLALIQWIAAETLASAGSTSAALLPPPAETHDAPAGDDAAARQDAAPRHMLFPSPAVDGVTPRADARVEVLIGSGRERRLLEMIATSKQPALVLTSGVDVASRWATRLEKIGPTVRLDSGVSDDARARSWQMIERGEARFAVGTRSALLAPLPHGAIVALIDEHEAAHKPPGPPRMHSRDVVLERARREHARLVFTSATPSVETWWRAGTAIVEAAAAARGPWPEVSVADTRGILRREPLTPAVSRALRDTLGAGRRAFLAVSRLASALACDECGTILRCAECAIALAYSRSSPALTCRLCGAAVPLMDTCPECQGRRVSPFGWGSERVEHAVRRRFPKAVVARYEPEMRGKRAEAQRATTRAADVVIGTRGALKLFGPASLGFAAFISPDQLLRVPDFRAAERTLELVWSAAERVRPDGSVIVQSQTPSHPAFDAVIRQDLDAFYRPELKFRAELGYPPFRRLAVVTIDVRRAPRTADDVAAALRGCADLVTYPPRADRRNAVKRIVVKGRDDLPALLHAALGDLMAGTRTRRGIMNVEVDPVEWQF